ncbi:RIP metalloprotease RseP [candidate division KSB1 bacterium]|nr:RIP metalloprotease RseP [candidate division KSB1 bacterium]
MTTLIATVFVLGVLIFVHELGHFLAAKLSGMRVERFSMGMPPRLFGKKWGDTDYCFSAIPFGGYVKITGMVDESLDQSALEKEPQPWEFRSKPWINRFSVIFAGPLMNVLLAYLIFLGGVFVYGVGEVSTQPVVGSLMDGKPAQMAGLLPGDRIASIDDIEIASWDQMAEIIHDAPGRIVTLNVMRGDSAFTLQIQPESEEIAKDEEIREMGFIGIGPEILTRPVGFFEAFSRAGQQLSYLAELIFDTVGKLITGKESIRSLAGPVAIAKMAGETARSGFGNLLAFMAMLSLNLGILNLLPIPVLDGGHLLFMSVEGLARRELPLKVKLIVQQVFMFLLIGLMLFVVYNDILRITR